MRGVGWLMAAWLGLAGCAHGPGPQPVADKAPSWVPGSAKVFTGPTGVQVVLVKPRLEEPDRVLMRITGTNAEIDGLVLAYRIEVRPNEHRYRTTLRGRDRIVLVMKYRGKDTGAELRLPGHGTLDLIYAADKTGELAPGEILHEHDRQREAGMLQAVQRFDRKREIEAQQDKMESSISFLAKMCGHPFRVDVAWDTVSDAQLKDTDLWMRCVRVIGILRELCRGDSHGVVKEITWDNFREISCRFGDELDLRINEKRLEFTALPIHQSGTPRRIRTFFLQEMPAGKGWTLQRHLDLDRTEVCTDGEGHYVGFGPYPDGDDTLFFGEETSLVRVPLVKKGGYAYFFEPREEREQVGNDPMSRYLSLLRAHNKDGTCRLRCGQRLVDLDKLSREDARRLLLGASLAPPPPRRKPFALARDRRGMYYFIDTSDRDGARDFRLYRGRKGNLKNLEMTNIVEDSQGAIFSTRSGKLRLIVEKENSFWVEGKKTHALINLPLGENIDMIYNQLGPYLGVPLGTPCDIL